MLRTEYRVSVRGLDSDIIKAQAIHQPRTELNIQTYEYMVAVVIQTTMLINSGSAQSQTQNNG